MKKNIYPVACFALLLMVPPIIMMIIGWHWAPETQPNSLKWILWLTDTAGAPYSIITSCVFIGFTLYVFREEREKWVRLVGIIVLCILAMQGLKSLLKNSFQEPRPYIVWLESKYDIPNSEFYDLKRSERAEVVSTVLKHDDNIPVWQRQHWESETGYSFPSGHMLFASGWALLLIGLFWQKGQFGASIILALWAEGIALSRMVLGMHWPSDIIASILISACFAILGYVLMCKSLKWN